MKQGCFFMLLAFFSMMALGVGLASIDWHELIKKHRAAAVVEMKATMATPEYKAAHAAALERKRQYEQAIGGIK